MSKWEILKIFGRNFACAAADSVSTAVISGDSAYSLGSMASAGIKTSGEIKEFLKSTSDALYSIQVETFLNTADLDNEEVEVFLKKHPDNLRLGIEIFKILEKTFMEKQAQFSARAFKKYVRGEISDQKLYEYLHVVEQLNRHIWALISADLEKIKEYQSDGLYGLPEEENEASIAQFFSVGVPQHNPLQSIGFIRVEPKEQELLMSGSIKPEMKYERTTLYLNFYLDLIK